MNELERTPKGALTAFLLALSACGGRAVDLDHATDGARTTNGDQTTGGATQAADPEQETVATRIVNEPAKYVWSAGDHLLWTNFGDVAENAKIRGCLKSHCDDSIIDYAAGLAESVAVSPRALVFGLSGILSCPLEGCGGSPTLVYDSSDVLHLALDSGYAYWVSHSDLTIYRCPLEGCQTPNRVVGNQELTSDRLVIATDQIYWQSKEELRQAKTDGSAPFAVVMKRADVGQFVVTGDTTYFVDAQNRIRTCRVGQCRDDQSVLVDTTTEKFQLQSDPLGVLWLEKDNAVRFCAADIGCASGATVITPPRVYTFTVDESSVYWSERVKDPLASSVSPTMESDVIGGSIHRSSR